MKKLLLSAALLAALSSTALSAEAFTWSNLNPFNWGRCCGGAAQTTQCGCHKNKCTNKCEKKEHKACPVKNKCEQPKPCDPCQKSEPCNPCDKLQEELER